MPQMLVLETANNPGNAATIQLAGAPTGYDPWVVVGNGIRREYVMRGGDGTREWGVGYVTAGTPNTFTRETVVGGSAGAGVRATFNGSVDVYSDALFDTAGKLLARAIPDAQMTQLLLIASKTCPGDGSEFYFNFDTVLRNDLFPGMTVPTPGFTIPAGAAGIYRATVSMDMGASGTGQRAFRLYVNGAVRAKDFQNGCSFGNTFHTAWEGYLPEGALVVCSVVQNSGGGLAIGGTDASTLTLTRLRG